MSDKDRERWAEIEERAAIIRAAGETEGEQAIIWKYRRLRDDYRAAERKAPQPPMEINARAVDVAEYISRKRTFGTLLRQLVILQGEMHPVVRHYLERRLRQKADFHRHRAEMASIAGYRREAEAEAKEAAHWDGLADQFLPNAITYQGAA